MAVYPIGTKLRGRYVLLDLIAFGGVSSVYQAMDSHENRRVAIKLLDPTHAGDSTARERVVREAIITDRVRHPSVPKIYDYGEAPLEDGTVVPYIVMELITGEVLAKHLAHGAMHWATAVRVTATIADVLAVVHRRGVIHRDLNETNIILAQDGPRLVDFGTAVTYAGPKWDAPTYVTPKRQPPANDFAGPGDPSDDVYALGVLLYQMLTGRSPYPNAKPPAIVAARDRAFLAPTPVLTVPGLPPAVAEICRRCMAKRPADRPDAATAAIDLWATIAHVPAALYQPGNLPAQPPDLWRNQPNSAPISPAPPVRGVPGGVSSVRQVAPGRWVARCLSTGQTLDEIPTVNLAERRAERERRAADRDRAIGRERRPTDPDRAASSDRRRRPAWSGSSGQHGVVRPL